MAMITCLQKGWLIEMAIVVQFLEGTSALLNFLKEPILVLVPVPLFSQNQNPIPVLFFNFCRWFWLLLFSKYISSRF
jgi:hypothetical protein